MSGTVTEIAHMLATRAQAVAEMLLPNGRKDGAEWRLGSTAGEKGQSLGVHLSGDKAGVWSDFSTGEKGDLLDLWCAVRSVTLAEAIEQARNWLGIERPARFSDKGFGERKAYTRPPKPRCAAPRGRVQDYLCEDRNVPGEILDRYRIGEDGDTIVFPFLLPDGTLAMAKTRKAEDGAAPKPTAANCEPVLFGWQAIPANAREIVITEGEIDALSMAAYGYPAMSVPFGGGTGAKQQWIENDFDRLDRFARIYLATDMDKPGDEAAEEIANRLGRHRCLRVMLPRKDANECLVHGVPKAEIDRAIAEAVDLDPEGLSRPSGFADAVKHLFWPAPGELVGYRTPYGKLNEGASPKLMFRPGEVTLWSGASGAGKSQILSDCIVDLVKQGARVCLSSLEMQAKQTLKRMVKQTVGTDRPTVAAIDVALGWLDDGLLIYEHVGKKGADGLIEVFEYARAKYGCDQFAIDSLMRMGLAADDYAGQEKVMFRLVDWTLANGVHLHVVAHSRKGERDRGAPETEDIKGAMEIGANASNILTVWRNRRLEEDIRTAESDEVRRSLEEKPGVILNVAKQRHGDFEGKVGLWFDQASYRYRSSYDRHGWDRSYLPRNDSVGKLSDPDLALVPEVQASNGRVR